jgi:hypothetical protein
LKQLKGRAEGQQYPRLDSNKKGALQNIEPGNSTSDRAKLCFLGNRIRAPQKKNRLREMKKGI